MSNLALKENHAICELVAGKEVCMSPRPAIKHNTVVSNISGIFYNYLRGKRCQSFCDGTEVWFDEENHFVPDAMIVCNPDIIGEQHIEGAPDLVVEILSPRTYQRDWTIKKDVYAKYGVREYWIIDPNTKIVAVHVLKDGQYELIGSYHPYTEEDLAEMDEEDRAEAKTQLRLKVSLYDDLVIEAADIFERVK